jgi:hypothetical protein
LKEIDMVRETFERELQRLQDETLALGSMVENALTASVDILKRRDMEDSRRLIAQDRFINEKRFAIEADALALVATQQPVARDMRTIAAILDIASELERIGDYAKGIAKINLLIGPGPLVKPTGHLHPGRSQHHRGGQLPAVGGPQPGARRRPGDQHLRACDLYRHGKDGGVGREGGTVRDLGRRPVIVLSPSLRL